jgi:hypothetical protein
MEDNLKLLKAGAELFQAQTQVDLTALAELMLMLSSMEAFFHLYKIVIKLF